MSVESPEVKPEPQHNVQLKLRQRATSFVGKSSESFARHTVGSIVSGEGSYSRIIIIIIFQHNRRFLEILSVSVE